MAAIVKSRKVNITAPPTEEEVRGIRGDCLIMVQSLLLPVTFTITYFISTSNGHVEKVFPYISDTGTWPPESCIFGILLCFFSLSTFLTAQIRWNIVNRFASSTVSSRLNNISLGMGIIASIGVLIVANFQETSLLIVHLIGAMMTFFIGTVYMWFQTIFSWRALDIPGFFRMVFFIRLFLTILTTLSAILVVPLLVAARQAYRGNDTTKTTPGSGKWDPDLGGYALHLASTSCEWAVAVLMSLFFLTFVREFRFVHFGLPRLHLTVSTNDKAKNTDVQVNGIENPVLNIADEIQYF